MKKALFWTLFWIILALLFNVGIWLRLGDTAALNFLSGYLIEKSLSVDNIFVFMLIFSSFKLPPALQRRALNYGIIGAIILRAIMIFGGVALVERFAWILYVFGVFLVFTGIKMLFHKETAANPAESTWFQWLKRTFPRLSPFLMVIILVELADVLFAVDSIPAIFAITQDPFIIFTSNIFAILGLRALYFVLADLVNRFYYLRYGLALILTLIGLKLLVHSIYAIPAGWTLLAMAGILTITVVASFLKTRNLPSQDQPPKDHPS